VDAAAVIVIFVLAGVWAAFLLPSVFASRGDRPTESAREFTRLSARLTAVGSGTTIEPMLTRRRVLARRRRALVMLALLAVGTLAVAIWRGSATLLIVHIGIDGVIAWYLAMLVQIRQRREASFVVNLREEDVSEEAPVRVLAHG
jgi:hypothetical protein